MSRLNDIPEIPTIDDLLNDYYKAIDEQADETIAKINQQRDIQKIEVKKRLGGDRE